MHLGSIDLDEAMKNRLGWVLQCRWHSGGWTRFGSINIAKAVKANK